MPTFESADNSWNISRAEVGVAEARALRLFIGRGKRYSVKQASNGSGVKDRMIECAMAGPDNTDWRPLPTGALQSLMAFLGPDFISEWLTPTTFAAHNPAPVDHEELLGHAINYVNEHAKARRRESPGGHEIVPIENVDLDKAAAPLRAA